MAEEFSTEELYSCLLKWLENCLALGGTLTFEPEEVNDGNALSECLVQLVPEFFTSSWRSRIITETGSNWKLKLNNLKKIHRSILDYYDSILHISLDKFKMPDLSLVAESGQKEDTARLIQLVLGIAINCDQKDTYIQAIMGMQQDIQHVVMGAIQDLMSYQSPSMVTSEDYKALEEENRKTIEELGKLRLQGETLLQEKHDLKNQLKATQYEIVTMNTEMEGLKNRLKEAETSVGITGEAKVHQLQRSLDLNKTEKLRLETERDEYKHKSEELEVQIQELVERNRNLQLENEEIPILRDSIEEMKYLESKVKNYESVISQYKKKVEDAQESRKQLKAMEDRNIMYMQQNLDLEEELRRLSNVKKQVDTRRHKVQELENALAQEKLRSLEAAQDAEEKSLTVDNLRAELMQVKQERDNFSQQVPGTPLSGEFQMLSLLRENRPFNEPDVGEEEGVGGVVEAFTPELREKMVRLEKENQILRKRLDSAESSPLEVEEESVRAVEQKAMVDRLRKEAAEWNQRAKEAENSVKKYTTEIARLEEMRKAKDVEIEKYKKYLNKAKKIIENIGESKPVAEDSLEIQSLRTQLKDKDKQLEQLEKEYRQSRSAWEKEEKLVVSAWHEMGVMMHRRFTQERLFSKHNMSFLSQQRQSLYRNPIPINTSAVTALTATGDGSQHS